MEKELLTLNVVNFFISACDCEKRARFLYRPIGDDTLLRQWMSMRAFAHKVWSIVYRLVNWLVRFVCECECWCAIGKSGWRLIMFSIDQTEYGSLAIAMQAITHFQMQIALVWRAHAATNAYMHVQYTFQLDLGGKF